MTPPPSFDEIGEEYVRQIVDLSPGQRKRYLGQLQVLARTPVRGSLVFAGPVTAIGEAQLKTSLIEWDRSLKTRASEDTAIPTDHHDRSDRGRTAREQD